MKRLINVRLSIIALIIIGGLGLFSFMVVRPSAMKMSQISPPESWPGTYQILVRSASVLTNIERSQGIVESNFLSTPRGGITLEQYQLIKKIQGIEVAAPVAPVGFISGYIGGVGIKLKSIEVNGLYQITYSLIDESSQQPQLLDHQVAYLASPDGKLGQDLFTIGVRSFVYSRTKGAQLDIASLPPMWSFVAGIDPLEEAKLVNLDKQVVNGNYFSSIDTLYDLGKSYDKDLKQNVATIPVIVNQNPYRNITASIDLKLLSLDGSKIINQFMDLQRVGKTNELMNQLDSLFNNGKGKSLLGQEIGLDVVMQVPNTNLNFLQNSIPETGGEGFYSSFDRIFLLYPGEIDYTKDNSGLLPNEELVFRVSETSHWEQVENQIELFQENADIGNWPGIPEDEPVYRPLAVVAVSPYKLVVRGTYHIEADPKSPNLIPYLPLGIYEPPLVTLKYNEAGDALAPRILTTGINPGSFISPPAQWLTTLEGAQYLSGRDDFISAIRVRVIGIDDYTDQNLNKIRQVAKEIEEQTGLQTDMILDPLPKKVFVYVPGTGFVEENWIAIGGSNRP